jgi:hypothetical protein
MEDDLVENSTDSDQIIIVYENKKYIWRKGNWSVLNTNLIISTALSQRLTEYSIKAGILSREDLIKKND